MGFDPAIQMRKELWDKAGEEVERTLPKNVTDELHTRIEQGKKIAMVMTMEGWDIIEKMLLDEMRMGKMISDAGEDKLDVTHTYRIGIVSGLLKRIYKLPQIAEKANKLLEKDAKRRERNGRIKRRVGLGPKRGIVFGAGGKRERV